MALLDFITGRKKITIKNCVRDPVDPRVSKCDVTVQEEGGIVRGGRIDVIGDNKNVYPLSKTGALTDEDFMDTVKFLKKGGWQVVVPKTKALSDREEAEE